MKPVQALTWVAVLSIIGGAIYYLEVHKPGRNITTQVTELSAERMPDEEKSKKFARAKELVNPSGFINTPPFQLKDLIGKQVILVDFWTYSCINCQRTLPYLNAWHEKYGDQGLTIVGVHTPEFEFEQKRENVQRAMEMYGVKYPVVQDNDYATWTAYGNRYWPRKYLIDIDGFIVYDHIGEGAYEETEEKIQALLRERAERLGAEASIAPDITKPAGVITPSTGVGSPEVYFGSARNTLLTNGVAGRDGLQDLQAPAVVGLNQLYLNGQWNFQPEYAENETAPASIVFRYKAKNVYMVAAADTAVTMRVRHDGRLQEKAITVQAEQLYPIIENDAVGEHTLELLIDSPGLQAFTFTFG